MRCVGCASEQFTKAGRDRQGRQRHRCSACGQRQTERSASAFCGYRFPDASIALAVRWYLRFRLSYAVMWTSARQRYLRRGTRHGKESTPCRSTGDVPLTAASWSLP
jgi:hypothetical protein